MKKMSPAEAREVLGVGPEATLAEIVAAFRRRAKETHPDLNPNHPDAAAEFQRVREAKEVLERNFEVRNSDSSRTHQRDSHEKSDGGRSSDPLSLVLGFLKARGYGGTIDGFEDTKTLRTATRREHFTEVLARRDLTLKSIKNEIFLDPDLRATGLTRSGADAALETILENHRRDRHVTIFKRLGLTLGKHGAAKILEAFRGVVANSFNEPSHLVVAVLLHHIWQVLQKQLGREIAHHLMPVVWSEAEGAGKSLFARWFLSPLKELCSPVVSIDDFLDHRFSGVMRYPVVFLDDLHAIKPNQVPKFNRTVTAPSLSYRTLGSSRAENVRNRTTLFSTANGPADRYFPKAFMRRIVSLEFRDGRQDPDVWSYNRIDIERVWRAVDPLAPSPILGVLRELQARQRRSRCDDLLLSWWERLDLTSREVRGIWKRKGLKARELYEIFLADAGLDRSQFSENAFADIMAQYFADPRSPFGGKVRDMAGVHYSIKAGDKIGSTATSA